MAKKVLIIGGGIAGLSAGIYSMLNGFETEIIEMHTVPGGQCTAWNRGGFRFDYCLHWLVGTAEGPFHDIWKTTGVLDDKTEIIDHEIHTKIINEKGETFYVYTDLKKWEDYLIGLAPEDEKPIRIMCKDMKRCLNFEPFVNPPETRSIREYISSLIKISSALPVLVKHGKKSSLQYFEYLGFNNRTLKSFLNTVYGEKNFPAIAFLMMLAWFAKKNAGYIKGGSLPLALRMLDRFKSLGGKFSGGRKAESVITENNTAKGIILENGEKIFADYIIGAADGYSMIFKMLGANYADDKIRKAYDKWELFTPLVQVSFGINGIIKSEAAGNTFINKGMRIGATALDTGYSIMNYAFDSTMAPEGKSVIVLRYDSPWELWKNMTKDEYEAEKEKIKKDAFLLLEKHHPGINALVEVIDVATPKTCVYYTGVRNAAYEGFFPTADNFMKSIKQELPGLSNFYMAGQWLTPGGGLPPSAQTGKWAVQIICRKEKKEFKSK